MSKRGQAATVVLPIIQSWPRAALVATAVVVTASSVVACGSGTPAADSKAAARSSTPADAPPFPPTDAKRATLRRLADGAASNMGVENPSHVRVFATTYGVATMALREAPTVSTRIGEPVYVVTMRGDFVAEDAPRPMGTPAPKGPMFSMLVDPDSNFVEAVALSNSVRDLSALGESVPLDR